MLQFVSVIDWDGGIEVTAWFMYNDGQLFDFKKKRRGKRKEKNEAKEEKGEGGVSFRQIVTGHCSLDSSSLK